MNPQGKQMVLEQLINRALLLAAAKRDLVEMDPEFKAQLAAVKDELLTKFEINRALKDVKVTEAEVKEYFDTHSEQFDRGETVNAVSYTHLYLYPEYFLFNFFIFCNIF